MRKFDCIAFASSLALPALAQERLQALHIPYTKQSGFEVSAPRDVSAVGDVDGDGRADLAIGQPVTSALGGGSVVLVDGSSGIERWRVHGGATDFGRTTAAIGDWSGDGEPDVLARIGGSQDALLALRGHDGAAIALLPIATSELAALVGIGDVDQDGVPDAVLGQPMLNGWAGAVTWIAGPGGSLSVTLSGAAPGDSLGTALAPVPDLDGDGVADLLIGAPGTDGVALDGGSVLLCSGANGATLRTWHGATTGELGRSFAAVADRDGDGLADVALGAPEFGAKAGRVTIVSSASGLVLATLDGAPSSRYGYALADGGDLNLDGRRDLLIGAPGATFGPPTPASSAEVRSGADLAAFAKVTGTGNFGAAVAAAGDTDGDGVPDFLVDAPWEFIDGLTGYGILRTFAGAAVPPRRMQQRLVLEPDAPASPFVDPQEDFGNAVGVVADSTGDGRPDLLVNVAWDENPAGFLRGEVRLHSGADGALAHVAPLVPGSGNVGLYVDAFADLGDVDGDGASDYAFGGDGLVAGGLVRIQSGASGATLHTLNGAQLSFSFGASLASVGDVDGDGASDVAVGEPALAIPSGCHGQVELRSSASGASLLRCPCTGASETTGELVLPLGDVDQDGTPDLVALARTLNAPLDALRLRAYSGASGATLWTSAAFSGSACRDGASIGDANGDGRADVLLASHYGTGDAWITLISGADGAILRTQLLTDAHDPTDVEPAGDRDGDGAPDFLVAFGLPNLFASKLTPGRLELRSSADFAVLDVFAGDETGERFAHDATAVTDIDGDGIDDVAVGVPRDGEFWKRGGAVRVLSLEPLAFTADSNRVRLAAGGTRKLYVDAPAHAFQPYWVLGSLSGASPGIDVAGAHVPLNPDAYFLWTLTAPNQAPLSKFAGVLNSVGDRTASLTLPAGTDPALAGIVAHHAAVVVDYFSLTVLDVSAPVVIRLEP